ncbi:jg19879 [Pararge aegeria aegeria]|uniref:Jg19879 protein n=2 Tax=Pararge aegeria TaxID=116150 RepID=A0A8S4R212_9NEOP|nr:jg19879 [Pararge aegeria aegeria]
MRECSLLHLPNKCAWWQYGAPSPALHMPAEQPPSSRRVLYPTDTTGTTGIEYNNISCTQICPGCGLKLFELALNDLLHDELLLLLYRTRPFGKGYWNKSSSN